MRFLREDYSDNSYDLVLKLPLTQSLVDTYAMSESGDIDLNKLVETMTQVIEESVDVVYLTIDSNDGTATVTNIDDNDYGWIKDNWKYICDETESRIRAIENDYQYNKNDVFYDRDDDSGLAEGFTLSRDAANIMMSCMKV